MGALGYRRHEGHRNKAGREHLCLKCQELGPMAGEISPDIMFWEISPKSGARACTWVQIDFYGCNRTNGHREAQKACKKRRKWMRRTYFSIHVHSAKKQDVGRDDHGDQREPRGAIEGDQGVPSSSKMHSNNKKARKQTGKQNETAKQGHANMLIKTTNCRKKSDTK